MDLLMTAGPTEISPRVRHAMDSRIQSPDFDEEFKEFYREIIDKLRLIYNTDKDVLILGGEAILGLETSVTSLLEKNDDVLCISNGYFGDGFVEFVDMRGGNAKLVRTSNREKIDIEKVKKEVEKSNYEIATLVHCETPTGVLNEMEEILDILNENQIITVVDAVSSLGGTSVPTDKIDICIGGSQKCFSTPPGLTTLSVSENAWRVIEEKNQETYYTNLKPWRDQWLDKERFPYSHLVTNLYGLNESLDLFLEEGITDVYQRHIEAQETCIELCEDKGLSFYPDKKTDMSPTVTAIEVKDNAEKLQQKIREESGILLSTGLGDLKNDLLRIGHMGYNADTHKVRRTVNAIDKATRD